MRDPTEPEIAERCRRNQPERVVFSGFPKASEETSRRRIVAISAGRTFVGCQDCSVGTRDNPIPLGRKRRADFTISIGKHSQISLCRGCALQFAEDFAAQLEVLTGVTDPNAAPDGCTNPTEHSFGGCPCYR